MDELPFEAGKAKKATLEAYTKEILGELMAPAGAAELKAAGVAPDILSGVTYGFEVRTSQLFGLGETVVVTVAVGPVVVPVAKKVLLDLWKDVIRPKIKRRFGDDAIGDERAVGPAGSPQGDDDDTKAKKPKKAKKAAEEKPAKAKDGKKGKNKKDKRNAATKTK